MEAPQNNYSYRMGNQNDLKQIMELAMKSWKRYKAELTTENWDKLHRLLTKPSVFTDLMDISHTYLCETINKQLIGMAFLVPHGNPTEIYDTNWSYIRFITVDPAFGGRGIGKRLTEQCIHHAIESNETVVALHTSEMMGNAIAIYEKLGFTILRELKPSLGKKYWLYTLDIDQ